MDVVILSWIDFAPGDRETYLRAGDAMMRATKGERGCVRHVMAPDPNSPTAVIAHAHYTDQEAFEEHLRGQHFLDFLTAVEGCQVVERWSDRFLATPVEK